MEDFEYSVEISDRDWDCFFAECEECDLLPPSLAGLDDSGMSDIDDTGSILAKRVQKVDLTAGFSEADHPIDGPPDCEGSPVDHYLSKHGVGGMESVLSGSEEDIHLQSINMFFERLKTATEAERFTEPSPVRAGKNTEAIQEEAQCSHGQHASCSALPKNIPKLNSLSARGETAAGKDTTEPVDTIGSLNTMKKQEAGSSVSPEAAASTLVLKSNKPLHPHTELFIREEAGAETGVNEATRWNHSHDSPDEVFCSETTPLTEKVIKMRWSTPLDDAQQDDSLTSEFTVSRKCAADSRCDLETMTNIKWKEDQNPASVSSSDQTSTNKTTASHESSPSAAIRRKRRKKRRLSSEPAETLSGPERQVSVKQSDSEEEQSAWRGGTGLCSCDDVNLFYLNEAQKHDAASLSTKLAGINLPLNISAEEIKVSDLLHCSHPCDSHVTQYLLESAVRQGVCEGRGSTENKTTNNRSVTPLSQNYDGVKSAPNDGGNVATYLQPCSKVKTQESTGLNENPAFPFVSNTDGETKSARAAETGRLWQADKTNHSTVLCENEQNPESCVAEVKSITHSILPSTESNDPAVEVGQNDKLSAAKSVLAVEAGNSGRENQTVCQRAAEPQQQLEIDCHYADRYSSTLEKTHFPLSANGSSTSDAHNTERTRVCPFTEASQGLSAQLKPDTERFLSHSPSSSVQQTEDHPVLPTLSKLDFLSEKNSTAERSESAASHVMTFHSEDSPLSKSQGGDKLFTSDDVRSPAGVTPESSCCSVDTQSLMSLSNENVTDMSGSSCLSVNQSDSGGEGGKTALILANHEAEGDTSGPRVQSATQNTTSAQCDSESDAEDAVTASKAVCEPEKATETKRSVFAMSSFWSEMEKLTINDILGLRMMSKAAPSSGLAPLQESEETDMFAMTDSGFFTQLDESSPEQTNENPDSAGSSLGCVLDVDSSSSAGLMWEREPVPVSLGPDIYPESMMLTSGGDVSQSVLPESAQKCLRKISKNISVRNLHALESESFGCAWRGQTLRTVDEGEKLEYSTDGHMSKQDKDMDCESSSSAGSYRISFPDIFQYLFSGKPSVPSQTATDNTTTCFTDGNSVPETYDHFFSEFDTESFFYPLITADDQAKDELVPIFSCTRSANRSLQFPDVYDHFFASSSSDTSSGESDEDDDCAPVRVVSRFSRTSSASKITDIYDNFFTDSDLGQNFFWKTTFSFRNIRFTGSSVKKQTLFDTQTHSPVRQSGRTLRWTVRPKNALGNQDVMFPDPLLYHLENRISRQLAQQPFRYQDLEMTVSNPRLDAPFLPLRQSDMCLVCIAFASWVLKTANPQVGDAWKAVLLANVSALSAIRYLRKYVKEAAVSEKKLQYPAPSDS